MQRFALAPARAAFDARDALVFEQRRYVIDVEPLAAFFLLTGATSPFAGAPTGSRRGYAATWELRDGRLYLVAVDGTRPGGGAGSLADLFPEFGRRVFAHWFSGTIVATQPRPSIGLVVLDGIDPGHAPATIAVEIERGIVLDAGARAAPAGSERPAHESTAA